MSIDEFRSDDFFVDEEETGGGGGFTESPVPEASSPRARRRRASGGLGLTPPQRLVLSVMLFMEVCVVGMFILIATGRMVPPGLY